MSRTKRRRRHAAGFTLIEVLLVLVILVILGSLAGVSYFNVQKGALQDSARTQAGYLDGAVKLYQLHMSRPPADLNALISAPSDDKSGKWKGPYWEEETIPMDPWDNEYQYEVNGATYKIWSMGPDGASGTDDDITG